MKTSTTARRAARTSSMSILAIGAALALAGCGGSGSPAATGTSTASAAASSAATPSSAASAASSGGGGSSVEGCPPAAGTATRVTEFAAAPPMCIDTAKSYVATVKTDVGSFAITLNAKAAPKTVNNFVFLARNKYYDGITFHRVIQGFMAQTGDPQGTGMGGPGYQFEDELPAQGAYKIGSVAMANAGANTNGSQFFIITGASGVGLDPAYSLFGEVTSGMDVVTKIEADGSAADAAPAVVHTMTSVTIAEK